MPPFAACAHRLVRRTPSCQGNRAMSEAAARSSESENSAKSRVRETSAGLYAPTASVAASRRCGEPCPPSIVAAVPARGFATTRGSTVKDAAGRSSAGPPPLLKNLLNAVSNVARSSCRCTRRDRSVARTSARPSPTNLERADRINHPTVVDVEPGRPQNASKDEHIGQQGAHTVTPVRRRAAAHAPASVGRADLALIRCLPGS